MTKKSHRGLARAFFAFCVFIAGSCAASSAGYRINWTPSVPQGIWKIETSRGPLLHRDDIVCVRPPDTEVFRMARDRLYISWGPCPGGYITLLKPVVAVPGDLVTVSHSGIAVNSRLLPNTAARETDSQGRPLNSFKPGAYPVPPGMVWLASPCPNGFDSRYFGPLPIANIVGVAKPIATIRHSLLTIKDSYTK